MSAHNRTSKEMIAMHVYGQAPAGLLYDCIKIYHRPSNQLQHPAPTSDDWQIYFGPKLTERDFREILFFLPIFGSEGKRLYITTCFEAWSNPRVQNIIRDFPKNLVEVRVSHPTLCSEAFLVRDNDNPGSWKSTLTSRIDTFSVDMALNIWGLEVIDLQPSLNPKAFDETSKSLARQKLHRFFSNVVKADFRMLFLPFGVIDG